jgi:small subunit ribosomal protein S6
LLRDYEILYIVRPELDEEQVNGAVETVNTLISNLGGTPQATNLWGKRRLAYEVSHLREGHYVLTDFQLEPARVPELEATLKISDTVFRHLVTRKPEKAAVKEAPAKEAVAKEEPAQAAAAETPAAAAEPVAAEPATETSEGEEPQGSEE